MPRNANNGIHEYARFGATNVRREFESAEAWEEVPPEDTMEAEMALRLHERDRQRVLGDHTRGVIRPSRVLRSEKNKEVAKELGLSADSLADRLSRHDDNRGTLNRVEEGRFDTLMAQLDLDPNEARDRFSGRYWREKSGEDKSEKKASALV